MLIYMIVPRQNLPKACRVVVAVYGTHPLEKLQVGRRQQTQVRTLKVLRDIQQMICFPLGFWVWSRQSDINST